MGCLGLLVIGALALAVPASIAPASLPGAYVVLGLVTAAALGTVRLRRARRRADRSGDLAAAERALTATPAARERATIAILVLAAGYAAAIYVIHAAAH